jgi:hypothetical protein
MDFPWKEIVGPIIKIAPTLTGVFAGPAAGKIAEAAGSILAEQLGVPATPGAVAEAITNAPEKAADALASEQVQAAIAQAQVEMMRIVNDTYREELKSDSPFIRMARPGWLYTGNLIFALFGLGYAKALWMGQYEALNSMGAATMFLAPALAVVGVISYGRTQEKIAGAANVPTSPGAIIGEMVGAALKKTAKK